MSPNFQRPLAAKLCVRPAKVLEVQERARVPLSPRQVWWGSDFTRCWGVQKRWVFLSVSVCSFVCLSVHHAFWTSRVCEPDFAMKALAYRNDFVANGWFVVEHLSSTFSDCCQLAIPLNAQVQKTAKIVFILPPQDDRINRSRRNLPCKHVVPWIHHSTPNLTIICKRCCVHNNVIFINENKNCQ